MMPNFEYTHSAEKAHDTTLDDENASEHVTSVVVMALCNQPKASASDLGDNQSRFGNVMYVWMLMNPVHTPKSRLI